MMKRFLLRFAILFICSATTIAVYAQHNDLSFLEQGFRNPPVSAKPWVFWYWMQGAVSKPGITADLEAMQQAGLGGAYLMPIKDTSAAIPFQPTARQLTPEWWALVNFAMQEAKRLNLQLAMHVSDGFALAGGPWIKPEQSMQKLVWTKTYVSGGKPGVQQLEQPETLEGYYKDIAVFAYPANSTQAFSDTVQVPTVTTSNGAKASFLCFDVDSRESFKCDSACWIQYSFPRAFTCRNIRMHAPNNFQAQRLIIQSSDDGKQFSTITRLEPPRQGWQDTDEDYTSAIPATTSKYFRFVYDKEGTEPGAEDLDAAKWKPVLRVNNIFLSDEPVIHQYESKNGSVWRIAPFTTRQQVADNDAIPLKNIIDLSSKMDSSGKLHWAAPAGNWVILRMGHTSTGHTNATGGAAKGLECDKFDPVVIKLQFDHWFGQAFEKTDPGLAKAVLKIFHVDSWECGSQNWSRLFRDEFRKRRGYDLLPWLPAMAGVPVENIQASEKFLHDIRSTIAELIGDKFYSTLQKLAHEKGCSFSAESVAPTMVSDGMLHYQYADLPMGEFWLNSPTHDKPNDMLDAVSGAHVYGKPIIQAEAFTSVRMSWGEHPGNLKTAGDRNFALGINRMVLHVFTHNPWMDRKPGMTLDGVGVYFQRDQTWWKQGAAWIKYLQRCQFLLQQGKPIIDIAVFTGEEVPRRSLLPDRLLNTLPAFFSKEKQVAEKKRLLNTGTPLRQKPDGVTLSANMADPEDWADALNGYNYDSFNPDVLLQASVKDGRIVLPGGSSYAALVVPFTQPMEPNAGYMSLAVAKKLLQLLEEGAAIFMHPAYNHSNAMLENDSALSAIMKQVAAKKYPGRLIDVPYINEAKEFVLQKDADIIHNTHTLVWTHRQTNAADIYFIANQRDSLQQVSVSFRINGKEPELWNAVTGEIGRAANWKIVDDRTVVNFQLAANASVFVIFRTKATHPVEAGAPAKQVYINGSWQLQFDPAYGGPPAPVVFDSLASWSDATDHRIKYYSGTVVYRKTFNWTAGVSKNSWLSIEHVDNIASIKLNGQDCGRLWTPPYRVNISTALKTGSNVLEITISNTWANRLIGDQLLPQNQRVTWTTAPFRLKDKPLLPAGIFGDVRIEW